MLLDRIDIDAHGPLQRVELGPFSEHLNVVCGPEGAGKTAIARFVRDTLVSRQYPLGMMSSSSGRVVWMDGNGLVQCLREQDGTRTGRTTIDFQPRGDFSDTYRSLTGSWLSKSDAANQTDQARALAALQWPEALVDSVITDTAVTNLGRVVSACLSSGLDAPETYKALPLDHELYRYSDALELHEETPGRDRRRLRDELADVEAEIGRIEASDVDYQRLVRRRDELTSRLSSSSARYENLRGAESLRARLTHLCELARDLRARQSDLRQRHDSYYVGAANQGRLDDADAQLSGWRRTLSEIRALREALLTGSDPIGWYRTHEEDAILRRQRLDGLLHWTDRYERGGAWNEGDAGRYNEVRRRIDSATDHIDWLLKRYASADSVSRNWYDNLPASASYRSTTTLGDTLRAIRTDLTQVRQAAGRPAIDQARATQLDDLRRCEYWLTAAIEQLGHYRDSLRRDLPGRYRSSLTDVPRDRELRQVTADLDTCLAEAADIRRRLRMHDDATVSTSSTWVDRDAVDAEIRSIDRRLASLSRLQWLKTRRSKLLSEIGVGRKVRWASPLAEAASRWLTRLSAGRLRRVEWSKDAGGNLSQHDRRHSVSIDGRQEHECVATDRALAVLAVRMAAGDLLAATGRPAPLLLETHRELLTASASDAHVDPVTQEYYQAGSLGRLNHPIAAALHDYTRGGRQVIVLTSSEALTEQLARAHSRVFRIHAQPIVHAHRPVWQPQYENEHYVGPHPHTYGEYTVADLGSRPVSDINRDFDVAWREANGFNDSPVAVGNRDHVRTDLPPAGTQYRDGYYYANTYSTVTSEGQDGSAFGSASPANSVQASSSTAPTHASLRNTVVESPFYLTVDSPIDQAPSVDAVAAARLRGLKVTHINHLMQQDSNRLADALGLHSVDAATVRRWQAECRLACRVPNLRGFDARVLVGCGVTDPAQLAAIHPVDLLQEVEAFLATSRGQQILQSGTSQELSRITSWIAAANSSPAEREAIEKRNRRANFLGSRSGAFAGFDSDRYEYSGDSDDNDRESQSGQRRRRRTSSANGRSERSSEKRQRGSRRSGRSTSQRSHSRSGSSLRSSRRNNDRHSQSERAERERREHVRYEQDDDQQESTSHASQQENSADQPRELRFYLQRDRDVVDAPSIGARMAERLQAVGIETVNDLLTADAESIAEQLDHRRVDADTVTAWQQQAELVCRVPMLRGHDAQLLVLGEVTSPEELAQWSPDELFGMIDGISQSKEGRRIIRGGNDPDLEEVTSWIQNAHHTRELRAA